MIHLLSTIHTFASSAAEEPAGIEVLGIDPIAIVVQSITFLLLLFIIKKFALTKIVATLEERRKTINRGLHLTSELDKLKAELDARVESAMHEARVTADGIINEARIESVEIIKASEESADRKANTILKDANAKIDQNIAKAKKELKSEIVSLVTDVTTAVLREKTTSSADRELTKKYLKEVL